MMQLSVKDVADNADMTIEKKCQLNERELRGIRKFIKNNYKEYIKCVT